MLLKIIRFVVSFIVLMLFACTNTTNIQHPQNELRVDIGSEPTTLDPVLSEDIHSLRVLADLFEGLVDYDQSNHVIKGMVNNYEVSEDGKIYTFHLRHNLKFSDGSPITSEDVIFSWYRLLDPKNKARYNFLLDGIVNAESVINGTMSLSKLGIYNPDKYTVIVNLVNPDRGFLSKNTLPNLAIVSKANILKYGDKWTLPQNMVTSGAYRLVAVKPGEYILATKNNNYYNADSVSINQVRYYINSSDKTSLQMYESNLLDTTFKSLPLDQYPAVSKKYRNELHVVRQEAIGFYEFNMKNKNIANNLKLRQALSLAVDRDELTKLILHDNKEALYSVVTPTIQDGKFDKMGYEWANWSNEKRVQYAKKLYKEAGFSDSKPFRITIMTDDNELYKDISLALANMWRKNLGVDVYIDIQDWARFINNRHNSNYQIARGGWFADYNQVSTYLDNYMCDSPQNDMKWCNQDYDRLIKEAETEPNMYKRIEIYKLAIKMVEDSYSIIPLFQFSYVRLVKPYVRNYDIEDNHFDHVQSKWFRF